MKRTNKLLILLVLLILAVLLYTGIVHLASGDEGGDGEDGSGNLTTLVSFETEDAEALSWSFEGEDGEEAYTIKKTDGIWIWPENPDLQLDQDAVDSLLQSVSDLTAESTFTLDTDADVSEYGMDEPGCSIALEFTADSGLEPVTILLGDYNSMAYGYYVMVEGGSQIGLVDSTLEDRFSNSPEMLEYVENTEDEEETSDDGANE